MINTSKNLDELIAFCNNISFNTINETINDKYKDISFLKNINDSALQVAKDDLDLYYSNYVLLSEQTNAFTKQTSESFKNYSTQLKEFKKEVDNMTAQFEKTIIDIAIPLSNNSNKINQSLRFLDLDESLTKYKQEIDRFNDYNNGIFTKINGASENLLTSFNSIKDSVESLVDEVKLGISEFNENIEIMAKDTVHEALKLIKDSFNTCKNGIINLKNALEEKIKELKIFVDDMKIVNNDDFKDIIDSLNSIILELAQFVLTREIGFLPSDIVTIVNIVKDSFVIIDRVKTFSEYISEVANVEISTSLDLLFIMDITGSMSSYLEEAKSNILSIINGIIDKCPGIDINLGFIGYRDFYEQY